MALYLFTLQDRNKWQKAARNLKLGQLVLVGDAKDLLTKGKYRVNRVAEIFPQMHQRKPIVKKAKMAVTNYDCDESTYVIESNFRDFFKIASK